MKREVCVVLVTLAVISLVYAAEGDTGIVFTESPSQTDLEEIQSKISNGQPVSTTIEKPTTFNLPSGKSVTVNGKVDFDGSEITADSIQFGTATIDGVKGFKETVTGYEVNSASTLSESGNVITNGIGIRFADGILTADSADSFLKANSLSSNVDGLSSSGSSFSVVSADSILSGCINIRDVKDSSFTLFNDAVEVKAGRGVFVNVNDCSENDVTFESNDGKVLLNKQIPTTYNIEHGTLTFSSDQYEERIDANNSAIIELDPSFGFSCMQITPLGTYWYNDNELEKDFGINIPQDAETFKLCLKKSPIQEFSEYDGLVNFIKGKVELTKTVNYLKYPFKNSLPSSLLMDNLFENHNFNAKFFLDNEFNFIALIEIGNNQENNIIHDNLNNKNNNWDNNENINNVGSNDVLSVNGVALTKPSNYYEIKEKTINNEIHRLIKINYKLNNNELTQNRIKEYKTKYFFPILNINNNVATQISNENKIEVLTPNNARISQIVN
ncbi:hypothetical protein ISS07_06000 [Candidatus Woesearchaeota archaeon]|nr:hypothetical protein [Candidatus Woesearchaeota archaeon]